MSLLRKYCNDFYDINSNSFSKLPLEERLLISGTSGYKIYIDSIALNISWKNFKESIVDSVDNKICKKLLKLYFRFK